jgi:hypothetical protein
VLPNRSLEKRREWAAANHRWSRDVFITDILWYPTQPVSFTFRDDELVLIEFDGHARTQREWDYSIEAQAYASIKNEVVEFLGKENRHHEDDPQNLEAVWEFPMVAFYVTCDVKTGGCGIGLRCRTED